MGVAPIKMPQLGESVTEGTVDRWLKKEGDYVRRDEPIVEVVTDKVNAEIPSPYEGRLVRISVGEGTTIPIGVEIAVIELAGAEVEAAAAEPPAAGEPAVTAAAPAPARAEAASVEAAPAGPRHRLSPVVRRLAEEHGVDVARIDGSGEGGRVTREDVLSYVAARDAAPAGAPPAEAPPAEARPAGAPPAEAPAAPAPEPAVDGAREELVRLSVMRRSIAEHMTRSLATSPHAWTLREIDVTDLVRYREAEKEGFRRRNGSPLTYLPFVVQVVCDALAEFPFLNSSWTDDGILLKRYVNMGIAVAVPDGLLVTGATGSIASQPIINQPQAAILTTEAIVRRPVVIGEGIAVRHIMNMCLSFDHRIIDGMTAGRFLGFIEERLEGWTPASIRM